MSCLCGLLLVGGLRAPFRIFSAFLPSLLGYRPRGIASAARRSACRAQLYFDAAHAAIHANASISSTLRYRKIFWNWIYITSESIHSHIRPGINHVNNHLRATDCPRLNPVVFLSIDADTIAGVFHPTLMRSSHNKSSNRSVHVRLRITPNIICAV